MELSRLGYLVDMKHVLVCSVVYSNQLSYRIDLLLPISSILRNCSSRISCLRERGSLSMVTSRTACLRHSLKGVLLQSDDGSTIICCPAACGRWFDDTRGARAGLHQVVASILRL